MLTLISPARLQDFSASGPLISTLPLFKNETALLVNVLKGLSAREISALMKISDKLGQLNFMRYQAFNPDSYTLKNSKQAILAYQGDVYQGLDAASLDLPELEFAEEHLLIVSGLYGLLQPLALIQPYRLEMSVRLATAGARDLYAFWQNKLAGALKERIKNHPQPVFINLLSEEYRKAIVFEALEKQVINVEFRDFHQGQYKIIGIHAKRARGRMARFIITERIDDPKHLTDFNDEGYCYQPTLSCPLKLVFQRKR